MSEKILSLFALFCFAMGCAGLEPMQVREAKYGKAVPVLHQSFASKQLRPGDTWKVYLQAADPDGDMKNIVCTIDQPGVGGYPVSITRIKDDNRKELSGYIYLNTFTGSLKQLEFVNLILTVQIEDMAGHLSKPAVFPLSFSSRFMQEPPPPGTFQEKDLGPIMIDLKGLKPAKGVGW